MACGCGKKAQQSTSSSPLTLGRKNGADAQRVTATVGVGGIPRGETAWVTGAHVEPLLARGYLVPA